MSEKPTILYFGNIKNTPRGGNCNDGHNLYAPHFANGYEWRKRLPFPYYLCDSRFCIQDDLPWNHPEYQLQGRCALHHVQDWSIVAFWDRSGDGRHGSNSAFLLNKKRASYWEVICAAKQAFPQIFDRLEKAGISLWECRAGANSSLFAKMQNT